MNWTQCYTPVGGSLLWSAAVAATPVAVLLVLLGVLRRPAWQAALGGVMSALAVAVGVFGMPPVAAASAAMYGAAFGLFPIGAITFSAILLYRITVESGQFAVIRTSLGSVTQDARLQALLIAFAFGAFIEGAAGSGTPVAVAGAMLTGLGFGAFEAAAICLLANTAPVAFGAIGVPVITLAVTTGLPVDDLSRMIGRICAPVSLFVPAYLIGLVYGLRGLREVWPAAALCGSAFASVQFLVSNYMGPQLTDILASLAAIGAILLYCRAKKTSASAAPADVWRAWSPYVLLAMCVVIWGAAPVRRVLDHATLAWSWPMLDGVVQRTVPVVMVPAPYQAVYRFDWLAGAAAACIVAGLLSLPVAGMSLRQYASVFVGTLKLLRFPLLTIAAMLATAFVMNYGGLTATLGLAFAATGVLFPYFSAMLGWLGVFLTGSDASANALFGSMQVVTAQRLGLDPLLTAAANSSGGVMGKMISLQSIAIAVAATGLTAEDEARLFRFTFRHSVLLASIVGFITAVYAYLLPGVLP